MREPSRFQLRYGRDEPPVETRGLAAGPLRAVLSGVDLRYVCAGDVEVVRRLFVAIRDSSWATIPPRITDLEVEEGPDSFRVTFDAHHEAADLRFRWRGVLAGSPDGTLECRMEGLAESDFDFNRIGFCVLHPRENAGRRYRARTPDGEIEGVLPAEIGPQRVEDGKLWPLFPSYERLEIEAADGVWARFDFEGDLFEMEDQRNWTDASFKTYSTPLTLGWPHRAKAGQEIVQQVRLTLSDRHLRPSTADGPARIALGGLTGAKLPALGLGMASHGGALTEREADLVTSLRPDHLRADLRLGDETWSVELARAADAALSTAAGLELALFLADDPEAGLAGLVEALPAAQARVDRILVFKDGETVTDSRWVRLARERLAPAARDATFAGGTDVWFTDVNRQPPATDGLDAVAYSLTATVHADDDSSLRETPAAQGDTVRSARAVCGALPIVVSPVTIRPRAWPFGALEGVAGLPFQVDPRQCSLFGAAWTAASAKHLAEAGAVSVTYFETTGWRGVLEQEGVERPAGFPSRPGAAFPLYHVLADLGEWDYGQVAEARSSRPLDVEALAVRTLDGLRVLVANLTPEPTRCTIGPVESARVSIRVLDEETAVRAGEDPEGFRTDRQERDVLGGLLDLELAPYAVVRIDG